jgi:hypothetical protein
MRHTPFAIAALLALILAEAPLSAKVALRSLAELSEEAEFIGVVRVEAISFGVPLLFQSRATATVLERWKGRPHRWILFGASPTWACDISDATKGEEAVIFTDGRHLLHAGRGRMPIFTRDGRRLANVWSDVKLPAAIVTEDGREPGHDFIRAVSVDDLRDAVRK